MGLLCFCQQSLGQSDSERVSHKPQTREQVVRPNIVLILADDLGFTDIAPYGSEINTPTLSTLAEQGIRFTNYHTAANCAPTRAMLLTGVDSHLAGVPNIPEMIPPEQKKHANYQGTLGHNVVTIATLLEDAGYHTYMAGKWHLGKSRGLLPSRRGFERTVALADSGADNWEQKPYLPIYEKANWYADGEEYELPEDFYSSRFLIDKMIEFIDSNRNDRKPFFAYIPFQAVHMPVQAPREFTDRYMGRYESGWAVLRKERLTGAVRTGIVPPDSQMVIMPTTEDWEALSPGRKRYEAKRMAVYAGMVEDMDFHTSRLIDYLKATGEYDNTVFIFTSDNGSEYTGHANPQGAINRFTLSRQGYSTDYETLGEKGSYNSISPSFTSASVAPLAFFKFWPGEGGMRVPLIIAGEPISATQPITSAFSFVTDIAATVLDLADVDAPGGRYGGRPVEAMTGRSLMPLISGVVDRVHTERDAVGYELAGNAVLFQGDYKIVFSRGSLGDNQWHLFNIVNDPGETHDLSSSMPQRLQAMINSYQQYAKDNGVQPISVEYDPVRQVLINGLQERGRSNMLLILLMLLTLLPFYVAYRAKKKG